MYCSNCGKQVPDKANFCPSCGHKLHDVKVIIENIENKTDSKESLDKTRVFNARLLDGLNQDHDIKEITNTLDEKISKEILKHTRRESQDGFVGPDNLEKDLPELKAKSKENKTPIEPDTKEIKEHNRENFNLIDSRELFKKSDIPNPSKLSKSDDSDVENLSSTFSETDVQTADKAEFEDVELENKKDDKAFEDNIIKTKSDEQKTPSQNESKKTRRSLKNIWDSFISERNDEFSIFSQYTIPGKSKEVSKTASKEKKEVVSNEISNTSNIEQTMPVPLITDEMLKKEDASKNDKNSFELKSVSSKDIEKNQKSSEKNTQAKSQTKEKTSNKKKNFDIWDQNSEDLDEDLDYDNSNLAFFKEVNKKLEESQKRSQKKSQKIVSKLRSLEELDNTGVIKFISQKNIQIISLTLILIFTILPIALASSFNFKSLIILSLLRIGVSLVEYFISIKSALSKLNLHVRQREIRGAGLLTWSLGALIIMLSYLINRKADLVPTILSALTPGIVGTIILCLLAIASAFFIFAKDLKRDEQILFLGWYSISFVIIEVLSKVLFLAINFIISAL